MCKVLGIMIIKKITLGLFILGLLNGCIQNSALVGPIYALGSTGNVYQASLSIGTNKAITSVTGESPLENVDNLLKAKKQDSMLRKLVKKQIKETRKKLKFTK